MSPSINVKLGKDRNVLDCLHVDTYLSAMKVFTLSLIVKLERIIQNLENVLHLFISHFNPRHVLIFTTSDTPDTILCFASLCNSCKEPRLCADYANLEQLLSCCLC